MIGKMLRYMRTSRNLRQIDLSRKLNIAQTTLSGYETHYSNPDFDTIARIAELCCFEIVFRDKITNDELCIGNITRKDI